MTELSLTTKTQAVFERLRLDIEDRVYPPGQWLRVHALAEAYGVSATPIREALRLLQSDGLIEHIPHRGVRVAKYPDQMIFEVYRLRAVLEPLAVELATERATDQEIEEIRRRHDALVHEIREVGVSPRLVALNEEFHWATFSVCGSHYLIEFLRRLWSAVPVRAGWLARTAEKSIEEHEELVQMMERRDARGAAAIMRRHVVPLDRQLEDPETSDSDNAQEQPADGARTGAASRSRTTRRTDRITSR